MIKTLLLGVCLFAPALVVAQEQKAAEQKPAPTASEKKAEHKADAAKKFHCDECNMDMKDHKAMRAHMKEHHGMEGYCHKCKRGFKTAAEEKAHMKEKHAKKTKADKTAQPAAATK